MDVIHYGNVMRLPSKDSWLVADESSWN